jgi:hypothetical protein
LIYEAGDKQHGKHPNIPPDRKEQTQAAMAEIKTLR